MNYSSKRCLLKSIQYVLMTSLALCAGSWRLTAAATNDTINGSVVDSISNTPLDSVLVGSEGAFTRTTLSGTFKLVIPATTITNFERQWHGTTIAWNSGRNVFSWSGNSGNVSIMVQNPLGRVVAHNRMEKNHADHKLSIANLPQGIYIATIRAQSRAGVYKIIKFQAGMDNSCTIISQGGFAGSLVKAMATSKSHTVIFTKTGYRPDTITVAANTSATIAMTVKLVGASAFTVLFDGKDLDNWLYNSANCSIKDSAIQCTGCWCMAWSKLDYDNFRLFVTCRVVNTNYTSNPGSQHMGIGIWGARRNDFVPAGCLEITPQNCWLWDYVNGNGPNTNQTCLQTNGGGTGNWNNWKTTEILANLKNGTIKTAVDGVAMTNYKAAKLSDWRKGPIGLQDHGNNPVEYKNIKIEVNPADTNLASIIK